MLQNIKYIYGNKLVASDGDIGHAKDFYFDDKAWVVRYLVADTGSWLGGRQVLLTPHAFGPLDRKGKALSINLTRKQIENSPSIDLHKPVSRQYEIDYCRYYGWPTYWNGDAMGGLGGFPAVMPPSNGGMGARRQHHRRDNQHLRSTKAVTGYTIQVADGEIGSVSGFMVDDKSWAVRELVVEAGHWYSGKEILIAPGKIERISYEESKIFVRLTKADIQRTAKDSVAKDAHGDHAGRMKNKPLVRASQASRSFATVNLSLVLSHAEISIRAEALWRQKGCPQGCDEEIWLAAERQLSRKLCIEHDKKEETAFADPGFPFNQESDGLMEELNEQFPGQIGKETTSL